MATKIICAATECKWCNNKCVCTAKTISLGWSSVMTLYDGRQEFNKCKKYELDEETKELYNNIKKYIKSKQ